MARRRMFSLDVVDTDLFLDLPVSSQALYFHLGMRADDDGFVSSPKRIAATINASSDDLKLLVAKGFVIPFDSGVCVIRDWQLNNFIRKDRYAPTIYAAEKSMLFLNGERYSLTPGLPDGNQMVDQRLTQDRVGKDSSGKEKREMGVSQAKTLKERKKSMPKKFVPPSLDEVKDYCKQRNSSVDADRFFEYFEASGWVDSKGNPVRNWKQKVITWEGRGQNGKSGTGSVSAGRPDQEIVFPGIQTF